VLVEAALVLPVLLMFVFGLIDFGYWNYQRSMTSSAARDGARVAILSVTGVDISGSATNTSVRTAIAGRLGNQTFTFTVRCMTASTTTTKTCTSSPQTVDRDRVEVQLTWNRPAMTFVSRMIGASKTMSATSRMTITG